MIVFYFVLTLMTDYPSKTRRKFLTAFSTVGFVGIAGCTGGNSGGGDFDGSSDGGDFGGSTSTPEPDRDGDGVPDYADDFPTDSTRSTLLGRGSDSLELNEDYYQSYSFSPSMPAVLSYEVEVRSNTRIDVILTDAANFRYFEDGTDWEYYTRGSDLDTTYASNEMQLGTSRDYYLIIDHTSEGSASPPTNFSNDRITVDVSYELFY